MTPLQLLRKAKEMEIPLSCAVDARKRYLRDQYQYFSQAENGGWYAPHRMSEIMAEVNTLNKLTTRPPVLADITDADIEEARAVPISTILPLDRMGKARNSCPNDSSHSLDLLSKANRMNCYVCDESWDGIGFIMKTMGLNFTGAVRYLIGR